MLNLQSDWHKADDVQLSDLISKYDAAHTAEAKQSTSEEIRDLIEATYNGFHADVLIALNQTFDGCEAIQTAIDPNTIKKSADICVNSGLEQLFVDLYREFNSDAARTNAFNPILVQQMINAIPADRLLQGARTVTNGLSSDPILANVSAVAARVRVEKTHALNLDNI
jgi:hypothetical protein